MRKPRFSCEGRPSEFNLSSHQRFPLPKDGSDSYKWHIVNFTNDMDKFKVINAIEKMFTIWQRAFDGIEPLGQFMNIVSTGDISKADIIISFGPRKHFIYKSDGTKMKCPYDFDGESGTLAHAWSLCVPKPFGGQIHFDEAENWSDMHSNNPNDIDLLSTALHETGHVWDIDHSNVPGSVMASMYNGIAHVLHADDHAAVQKKLSVVKWELYNKYHKGKQIKKPIQRKISFLEWLKIRLS